MSLAGLNLAWAALRATPCTVDLWPRAHRPGTETCSEPDSSPSTGMIPLQDNHILLNPIQAKEPGVQLVCNKTDRK